MIVKEELQKYADGLQEEIDGISPHICRRFPISAYIDDVKSYPEIRMHSYFRPRRKRIFSTIQKDYGFHAIALYQKLSLCFFIINSLNHLKSKSLPQGVLLNLHSWYQRVVKDFDRQPDTYYDISKIDFNIDFGVCCLKSLPIGGAWFVKIRMINPRVLLTFDVRQMKRILGCILFKTKGYFRYCVIHTVPRYLLRFNCKQMNLAYKEIGELMKYQPKIKGIFRKSWFLDPNLENISPELTYLREIPQQNGAIFFEVGTTHQDIVDSLAFSPYRRKLHEEGKFFSVVYGYIWPKKEFLEWLSQKNVGRPESCKHRNNINQ
jgi:hypothetical protein